MGVGVATGPSDKTLTKAPQGSQSPKTKPETRNPKRRTLNPNVFSSLTACPPLLQIRTQQGEYNLAHCLCFASVQDSAAILRSATYPCHPPSSHPTATQPHTLNTQLPPLPHTGILRTEVMRREVVCVMLEVSAWTCLLNLCVL